jgi:hypothetical protein
MQQVFMSSGNLNYSGLIASSSYVDGTFSAAVG